MREVKNESCAQNIIFPTQGVRIHTARLIRLVCAGNRLNALVRACLERAGAARRARRVVRVERRQALQRSAADAEPHPAAAAAEPARRLRHAADTRTRGPSLYTRL